MNVFRTPPDPTRKLVADAGTALREGDLARSEMLLVQAVERSPGDAEALFQLAGARFAMGDLDGSLDLLSRCIAAEPRWPEAHAHRGKLRHAKGDFAGALADFDAELRLRPDDVDTLLNRGISLGAMGRTTESLVDYERVMRLAPSEPGPYINRALLLGDADPEAAIADLSAAIEREPRYAPAWFGRGLHRLNRGELREALRDLQQAVRLGRFPNDQFAVERIRALHLKLAANGGPPMYGLRPGAAWIGRATAVSETLAASSGEEGVTVPPGHKVTVVHPSADPFFAQMESGIWLAGLGNGTQAPHVVGRAAQLVVDAVPAYVVWICLPAMLDVPATFDPFLQALGSLVGASRGTVDHCFVVAHAEARHHAQMRRIAELGISVQQSGPDGSCFLEVHTPGGISVGFTGPAFHDPNAN